jgi:alpha-glucuronidase
MQTNQSLSTLDLAESPKIKHRMLNHWDWAKNETYEVVERGYAGTSIWKWDELPGTVDPRYTDYARANASIGINGTVLNNVNAVSDVLESGFLVKVQKLADIFRPYGIKVYLTAPYAAPKDLGAATDYDCLNQDVIDFWNAKADEIYTLIPDFGGFLIKAGSEGQGGPNDSGANTGGGRTVTQGANMLAQALEDSGGTPRGVVIWRTFVYDKAVDADRVKRAYKEFIGLDNSFNDNVIVQTKNGPFDFQPREPFHPLFGAMSQTNMGMEFQITQEYLGHSTHLVYVAPQWKEVLDFDTYAAGAGSTVGKVVDGTVHARNRTMIAGVANIGSDTNWCGHHFAQANWYAYGRLAWDHGLTSAGIADEWIRMTWSNDSDVRTELAAMMLPSWEAAVNYMAPLGLAFTVSGGSYADANNAPSHYLAHPGGRNGDEWLADSNGLGYDRTVATGSAATAQYFSAVGDVFDDIATCPEKYLLWFHQVPWNHTMDSGRTMWEELCYKYNHGLQHVLDMQTTWNSLSEKIDPLRFAAVQTKLSTHLADATDFKVEYVEYFDNYSALAEPAYTATGYTNWAHVDQALSGSAAFRNADLDGDGLPNLLEYAFGGDPEGQDASQAVPAETGNLEVPADTKEVSQRFLQDSPVKFFKLVVEEGQ